MEIPAAVRQRLGGEEIQSAVNLGDEDLICFTPTRTLLYSGEGLLSDESVEVYDHDAERLNIATSRRKTAFTLEYVDRSEKFSVPRKRGESVLERLLDGVLKTTGVIEDDEEIQGVFRFSEMSLVVTDRRLVKHVGAYLWDPDYEEFHYEDVTGLTFEDGSVATQVVISTATSQQRIKAPNDQARILRETLQNALFAYHEVESLDRLNETLRPAEEDDEETDENDDEFSFDDSIAPLVGDRDDDAETVTDEAGIVTGDGETVTDDNAEVDTIETTDASTVSPSKSQTKTDAATDQQTTDAATTATDQSAESAGEPGATATDIEADASGSIATSEPAVDPEDIEAIEEQLSALTQVVKKQHDLLSQQQETIEQLIEELREQR